MGTLDITLYRDDLRQKTEWPKVERTEVPFDLDDKKVILVDDVIHRQDDEGRHEAIMDSGGRPRYRS